MKILGNTDAVKRLCLYNLFNALAIAPACNLTFTDKLMLHMNLALENFGYIKGIMFLVPPLLYALLVPLLNRIHADIKICINCYIVRASLPALLPVLALFTDNKSILTAACIFVLTTAMTCAVFANNSLMAIYRLSLRQEDFNRNIGLITLYVQLPSSVMALPLAWYLDLFEGAPPYHFYLAFAMMHVVCVLFEIPAVWNMLKLHLKYPAEPDRKPRNLFWTPYKDMKYLPILILTILNGIICGLSNAYLVLYLLEGLHLSVTVITIVTFTAGILLNTTLPFCGNFMDKIGYPRFFLLLSIGILCGYSIFCIFWGNLWIQLSLALLASGGSTSLLGGWLTWALSAAGSKLLRPDLSESYISAYSISYNGGLFLGCSLAGVLITVIKNLMENGDQSAMFHYYFLCMLLFAFLVFCGTVIYRYYPAKIPSTVKEGL